MSDLPLKASSGPETSSVTSTLAIALLVTAEFVALSYLSTHSQPPSAILIGSYTVAFASYVGLIVHARRARAPLWIWFGIALLLRTPWIFAGVSLSDDVWRYLHDGHAQLAGVNPFRFPPAAPEAAAYGGPEYDLINNPELPTIYPPFAQLTFLLAAALGGSLLSWKLVLLLFDVGIGAAMAPLLRRQGLPVQLSAVYLVHPLPVIEFAGNGHVDAIAIFGMLVAFGAVGKPVIRGAAFAASVAAKYLALPITAFLARPFDNRSRLVFAAAFLVTLLLVYLPYTDPLPLGSLSEFARRFEFNSPIYESLAGFTGPQTARWALGALLLTLLAWLWKTRRNALDAGFVWISAVLLVSPILHPWYVTWLIPFLAWRREPWALTWTGTVVISYTVLPAWWSDGIWELSPWAKFFEFAPVYALLLWRAVRTRPRLDTLGVVDESARAVT